MGASIPSPSPPETCTCLSTSIPSTDVDARESAPQREERDKEGGGGVVVGLREGDGEAPIHGHSMSCEYWRVPVCGAARSRTARGGGRTHFSQYVHVKQERDSVAGGERGWDGEGGRRTARQVAMWMSTSPHGSHATMGGRSARLPDGTRDARVRGTRRVALGVVEVVVRSSIERTVTTKDAAHGEGDSQDKSRPCLKLRKSKRNEDGQTRRVDAMHVRHDGEYNFEPKLKRCYPRPKEAAMGNIEVLWAIGSRESSIASSASRPSAAVLPASPQLLFSSYPLGPKTDLGKCLDFGQAPFANRTQIASSASRFSKVAIVTTSWLASALFTYSSPHYASSIPIGNQLDGTTTESDSNSDFGTQLT
ncbi:hypothetical protein B0H13DRAFT_1882446 [Mycena leptocephala]|nr:hypothetical protein B0H13DRAFT_1882446 [Mycena leptocephala]